MINETILYLSHTGCGDSTLKKHEKELNAGPGWDPDMRVGEPLKKVFSKVLRYDFGVNYAALGCHSTNRAILDLVRREKPKYVMWPSMMYEIQESTFQAIRQAGSLVVGWFFDDEIRFEEYSRWWIPYLDFVVTCDKESVKNYQDLGIKAQQLLVTSNSEFYQRLNIPRKYAASFIGTKIADRGRLVEELAAGGIEVHAFGRGWNNGYVSNDDMVTIYNASKINLCFVKSYQAGTRPQMKSKIFDITMCGGFLLCEYLPGIEDYFEIDKEIVCFQNLNEAVTKIRYYLQHKDERQAIAQAGWERAQRDYPQSTLMMRAFQEMEKDGNCRPRVQGPHDLPLPEKIRRFPANYHLNWAKVLLREGFPRERWQEELALALSYNPGDTRTRLLRAVGSLPRPLSAGLIRLWDGTRTLRERATGIASKGKKIAKNF